MTSSFAKFSAIGKQKNVWKAIKHQIDILNSLVIANSVSHVREFPRKELIYDCFIILILANIPICF